jgi:hydroxyacylglutathione hydrolase
MVTVLHVPAFEDNYIWLLRSSEHVAVVDPGDAQPVIQALERERLRPAAVLCTHHHRDHVGGVGELAARYGMPVFGPAREQIPFVTRPLDDGDRVDLPELGLRLEALATPGHTLGQINYFGHGMLFCGDTLFSAGCGRLFEGTPAQMHASLSRLAALPPETQVYCGHEYTAANLRFAQAVEPDNADVREHTERVRQWRSSGLPSLPSTIGLERRINPFLRCAETSVRQAAQARAGATFSSALEVFATVRRWKDEFRG